VNKAVKFAVAVLWFAPLAGAQDQTSSRAIMFPGSARIGNYSPSESTVLFDSYAERGATIYRAHSLSLTLLPSLALDFDTKDWENLHKGRSASS